MLAPHNPESVSTEQQFVQPKQNRLATIFTMAGRPMAKPRWLRQKELRNYAVVSAWLLGVYHLWAEGWLPLINNILSIWRSAGPDFLVKYLKESVRILQKWMAGEDPGVSTPWISKARDGLPRILPAPIRIGIRLARDGHHSGVMVFKAAVTILSVYRVIGASPILKLETITSQFTGSTQTLAQWEVEAVVRYLGTLLRFSPVRILWINESAGPNYPRSSWGSPLDAIAFIGDLRTWMSFVKVARSMGANMLLLWQVLLASVGFPLYLVARLLRKPLVLGRLQDLAEGAGKVRVIAIVDWWTQTLLRPLHDAIFALLKKIPQDGTFDQHRPAKALHERIRSGSGVWSFDLSAATDRIPIQLQIQILSAFGIKFAQEWADLLVGRSYWFKGSPVRYAVGQPMGAYSSWAILALSHHVIVQVSALRAGWTQWFPHYAVLGDDIIIADRAVADQYLLVIGFLGVTVSPTKGLKSEHTYEFAKQTVRVVAQPSAAFPGVDNLSPLGPSAVLVAARNVLYFPILIQDAFAKGVDLSLYALIEAMNVIPLLRRNSGKLVDIIALSALSPSGPELSRSVTAQSRARTWLELIVPGVPPAITLNWVGEYLFTSQRKESSQVSTRAMKELRYLLFNWWRYPLLGTTLITGFLSLPVVFLGPGLWAYISTLWSKVMSDLTIFGMKKVEYRNMSSRTRSFADTTLLGQLDIIRAYQQAVHGVVPSIRFEQRGLMRRQIQKMMNLSEFVRHKSSSTVPSPAIGNTTPITLRKSTEV